MSRIVRNDPYLTREDTGADEGRTPAVQHYEKQNGSDGATSNTVFTLSKPYVQGSNTLLVFVNGQKAELLVSATDTTEYEETSSLTVTFGDSLLDTDVVEFIVVGTYFIQDTDIYVTKSLEKNSNIIINGDLNIWQRGTSFAAISNTDYFADRWRYGSSGTGAVWTASKDTSVKPSQTDTGGPKVNASIKMLNTTADAAVAAGDSVIFGQKIEGYDIQALPEKYVTLSFWVRATETGKNYVSFRNSTGDRCYLGSYTINESDTWEKKTISFLFSPTAGGTWNYTTGIGLHVDFCLMCGSTYHGTDESWSSSLVFAGSDQVNHCGTLSNTFYLAQVKFEIGSDATPFIGRPYAEELALCQRYYETGSLQGTIVSYSAISYYSTTHGFRMTKRSTPTLATPDGQIYFAGSWVTPTTMLVSTLTNNDFFIQGTHSGMTGYAGGLIKGNWTAEAEL